MNKTIIVGKKEEAVNIELIKIEIKVPKHWHDHILEWAKKHGSGFDSFEEIILSFTHRLSLIHI